jgi:hypothetical protein
MWKKVQQEELCSGDTHKMAGKLIAIETVNQRVLPKPMNSATYGAVFGGNGNLSCVIPAMQHTFVYTSAFPHGNCIQMYTG